jgi:peptidoglycan/LPS O-acetylase OafA/YrhL
LAVAAVVAFHSGHGWASGGFLGVSVFFTLSGFLITSLLIAEHRETGSISLLGFWSRRARRLLPAALLGLVLALLVSRSMPNPASTVRGDVLASLFDVANWRFLTSGQPYADLFTAPSPVLHYWSLAIEEQLYLLVPIGALLALRRSRAALVRAIWTGIAVSWGALVVAGALDEIDFAYYSTVTRAGELLAGAALALVATRVRIPFGGVALALLGAAVALVDRTDRLLYLGGLPLVSLLSCAVIVAACRPGVVRSALSSPPLVALGRISYGVYVYHWPLFLWLSPRRTDLSGAPLTMLRVAATLVLAIASHHLLERPIRERRWPSPSAARLLVPAAFAAVVALTLGLGSDIRPEVDLAAARAAVAAPPQVPVPAEAPKLAMLGDSTALMTSYGLTIWGRETGRFDLVGGWTELGCGVGRGGQRLEPDGKVTSTLPECDWSRHWPAYLRAHPVDAAIVQVGPFDIYDRRLPGDDAWRSLGDPVYDEFLRRELTAALDLLLAEGVEVIWLTSPWLDLSRNAVNQASVAGDPDRTERYNSLVRDVAAGREGVTVVDLAGYLARPEVDDERLRPDGVHLTAETATEVTEDWLGDAVVEAVAP